MTVFAASAAGPMVLKLNRAATQRRGRRWTIARVISPLVLLTVWQLGSAAGFIPADVLPAPSVIARAGVELISNGQLADALRVSVLRVVQGLLLGRRLIHPCRCFGHCRISD